MMCKEKNNVGFHNFSERCRQIGGRINANPKLVKNVRKEEKNLYRRCRRRRSFSPVFVGISVSARKKQHIVTSDDREMNKALKIYWIIFYHRHLVIKLVVILANKRKKIE